MPSQVETRARLDQVLRRAVETREVLGVVAIAASDDGPIYEGAFGVRDLATGPAMTLDTVFRIFSMTKAVTCVAAMQLVEQGKLSTVLRLCRQFEREVYALAAASPAR